LGVLLLLLASALVGPIIESIKARWNARKVREQLNDMRTRTEGGRSLGRHTRPVETLTATQWADIQSQIQRYALI